MPTEDSILTHMKDPADLLRAAEAAEARRAATGSMSSDARVPVAQRMVPSPKTPFRDCRR